jgi:hypothetical protein
MITRQTAPKWFHDLINAQIPEIQYDMKLRSLILYLMFPTWLDNDTKKPVLEQSFIAKLVNEEDALNKDFTFSAECWLQRVKKIIPVFEYSGYNFDRARIVLDIQWPPMVEQGLKEMKKAYHNKSGDVFLLTGAKVNRSNIAKIREKERMKSLEEMQNAGVAEARTILSMLNALSVNMFSRILNKIDDVWINALNMPDSDVKETTLNLLRLIAIQPQPFYKAVQNSVRLYAMNDSILRLPRKLRKLFLSDLITLDLRASQLSIIAKDWNIPSLQAFLENDGNIWQYLFSELGLDYSLKQSNPERYDEIKSILKQDGLYAIIYGRNVNNMLQSRYKTYATVRARFASIGIIVLQFLQVGLIQDILIARRRIYADIRHNKGAHDIFGRWIQLNKDISVESIASQLAQATELWLMYPIVQEAFKTSEFTIVVWLHDSVSISISDKRRSQYWIGRLQEVVRLNGSSKGYISMLEIE